MPIIRFFSFGKFLVGGGDWEGQIFMQDILFPYLSGYATVAKLKHLLVHEMINLKQLYKRGTYETLVKHQNLVLLKFKT